MRLELEKKTLTNWFKLLKDISSECRLHTTKDGLEVKLVDGANVCMLHTKIPSISCMSYDCDDDNEYGLDVNLIYNKLSKITSSFGNTIILDIDGEKTKLSCGRYSYTTKTKDTKIIRQEPRIPNIANQNNKFTISTVNLYNATLPMNKRGHVIVSENKGVISFTQIEDEDKTEVVFGDEVKILESDDSRCLYSCDYLKDITPAMKKVCIYVDFIFGTDYPCSIIGNGDVVYFEYLLAPRIESD